MDENSTEVVEQNEVQNIDTASNKAANVGAKAAQWTHEGHNAWKALIAIFAIGLIGGLVYMNVGEVDGQAADAGWDEYFALVNEIQDVQSRKSGSNGGAFTQSELDSVKTFVDEIVGEHEGLRSASAAQVLAGDLYLHAGMRILYSDREAADGHLEIAEDYYKQIIGTPVPPSQRMRSWLFIRAGLGLAQASEARMFSDPAEGEIYELKGANEDSEASEMVDAFEYHRRIALATLDRIRNQIGETKDSVLRNQMNQRIQLIESLSKDRWTEGDAIQSSNFYSWLAQYQPPVVEDEEGSGIKLENNINPGGEADPERESEFPLKDDEDSSDASSEDATDSDDADTPNDEEEASSDDTE